MSCEPIQADSLEYLPIRIGSEIPLGTQSVEVAILADANDSPEESDWKVATWDDDDQTVLVLIGPGGGVMTLTPGRWYVYVRIDAPPEKPIIYAGPLTVE